MAQSQECPEDDPSDGNPDSSSSNEESQVQQPTAKQFADSENASSRRAIAAGRDLGGWIARGGAFEAGRKLGRELLEALWS